ncbi:hypothetical protein ACEQ8H_006595 [Pleosporales sp. CAS-2024a]
MVRAVLLMLGVLGAAIAQNPGPAWNPATEAQFGAGGIVYPSSVSQDVATITYGASPVSSAAASTVTSAAVTSHATPSSTFSTSASARASPSRTSSASKPAQTTNAAVGNAPGIVGVIAGGVFAGLAML